MDEKGLTHQVGVQLEGGPATALVRQLTAGLVDQQGRERFRDGIVVKSEATGTAYRLEHVQRWSATLRRVTPKVRGKAARKAEKLARRAPWRSRPR